MGVRRLRVVDPRQVCGARDNGSAVTCGAEGSQARLHGLGFNAVGPRQGRCSQCIRENCG